MLYYIYIESKTTKEQIVEVLFHLLKIESYEILFFDGFFPEETENYHNFLVQLIERPAGFLTSLEMHTNFFTSKENVYHFLKEMSQHLSSRIFIDETERTGKLISPNEEPREVFFDIGEKNEEEYIFIVP